MGLVVDEIIDIIEEKIHIDLSAKRPGYIGTSIIAGKATAIIDATYYLNRAHQEWFTAMDGGAAAAPRRRILLVDASASFRDLMTPLLTVAGYDLTAVANAADALALREAAEDFDAIVSAIEMPEVDGCAFAAAVRRSGRWVNVPMLGLSSHATPRDLERIRQVGFTDHVIKHNREALLASLQQMLDRPVTNGTTTAAELLT
jgi:two-component system chemotaxis sensor kinase CheA